MGKIILNGTGYGGSGGSGGVIYLPTIYSEEEREVGVWKDGKPLYQRTYSGLSVTSSTSFHSTGITTSGIETLVNAEECGSASDGRLISFNVDAYIATNGTLYSAEFSNGWTIKSITLQYTKTTDTAGSGTWTPSGANAVHYSTNEQVIGTWIDGKPLYEKVVKSTTTPTANAWNPVALPADISVKTFDAYYVRTTGAVDKFSMYRGDTSPAEFLVFNIENGTLYYRIASQYIANFSEFVSILQYTKTTD